MNDHSANLPTRRWRWLARASAAVTGTVGVLILAGWAFDVAALKGILPGLATMKANTALGFLLAGVGLWLVCPEDAAHRTFMAGRVCAAAVAMMGFLTLGEYLLGNDWGIDQLLVREPGHPGESGSPGRMAPMTACNFLALGLALLLLAGASRYCVLAQFLAVAVALVSLLSLMGYAYGVRALYHVGPFSSVAVHTAATFFLLAHGVLCARPRRGLMALFLGPTLGGWLIRRQLPTFLVAVFVLGWLRALGQDLGLFDTPFGIALMVVGSVTIFGILVGWTGWTLHGIDRRRQQAEARASEANERVLGTLESMTDGFLHLDRDWRIVYMNPECERQCQRPRSDQLGKVFWDEWPATLGTALEAEWRKAMAERVTIEFENYYAPFDRWFAMKADPTADGGLVIFTRDITERKRAAQQRLDDAARIESIVNHAIDGLIVIDENGTVEAFNPAAERLFGYRAAEVIGGNISRLMPEPYRSEHDGYLANYRRTGQAKVIGVGREVEGRRKDGSVFPLEIAVSEFRLGQRRCFTGMVRDVTERNRADEKIRHLNENLERLVRQRTAELEAANKELEAFSYSVSHDLRMPLRAIDGFARILLQDHAAELSSEGQEYLQLVRNNALLMGQLVDDLLAFSRLSRQPIKKQTVEPAQIVSRCLEELRGEREGRQVEVVVGDLPACQGEPSLLKQVWLNLLSNALKYTRKRPAAHIEVGCRRAEGSREMVYYVKDNGVGFDMRYARKLFGVFQRLHRAEDFEGTGVGLAIVQRIVHRHGGRVWAEAEPGRGAAFFFTLEKASAHDG